MNNNTSTQRSSPSDRYFVLPIEVILKTSINKTSLVVSKDDTVDRVLFHVHRVYNIPLDNLECCLSGQDQIIDRRCPLEFYKSGIAVIDITGGYTLVDVYIQAIDEDATKMLHLNNIRSNIKISDLIESTIRTLRLSNGNWKAHYISGNSDGLSGSINNKILSEVSSELTHTIHIRRDYKSITIRHINIAGEFIKRYAVKLYEVTSAELKDRVQPGDCSAVIYQYNGDFGDAAINRIIKDLNRDNNVILPLIAVEIKFTDLNIRQIA